MKGIYDEFGVILLDEDKNYISFEANGKGKGSYSISYNKDYVKNPSWRTIPGSATKIFQKITVDGKQFQYEQNGTKVYEGEIIKLGKLIRLGLRVCDKQTIEFESIKITDTSTGKVIFTEDFNPPKDVWQPKIDLNYIKKITDAGYFMKVDREDWCYWTKVAVDFSGNCDFTLRARWLEGETNYFGFLIFEKGDNYTNFRIKSNGEASYNKSVNDEYIDTSSNMQTGYESDGQTSVNLIVKVRKKEFQFYVNDFFVASGRLETNRFKKIAVRVCGSQTVLFEKLVIEEL